MHIVMEFADRGDIGEQIAAKARLADGLFSEGLVLDWFIQVSLGIKYIHDRGIVHRDIKAQNIFLTSQGIVKLGDFGIAKELTDEVSFAQTQIGTPFNLSPELCEGKPYDQKTDVWALGCFLYEIATLKHPFEAINLGALFMKIVRGKFTKLPDKFSPQLRDLLVSLLVVQVVSLLL